MESSEVSQEPTPLEYEKISLGEQLDELCAYYMSMGVSFDEFWYGDYTRLKYYRRKQDFVRNEMSQQLWLQGLYFYDAVGSCLSGGKHKYMKEPIATLPKTEFEKARESQRERERIVNAFKAMAMAQKYKR